MPRHLVDPGSQIPVHTPEAQACPVQGVGVPQLAVISQVWTPLPEHWTAPGEQVPVQVPATHVWLQATG